MILTTGYFLFVRIITNKFNALNADLNPICHLLAILGAHSILHVSRIRVKILVLVMEMK
jgi:hypothetical protein